MLSTQHSSPHGWRRASHNTTLHLNPPAHTRVCRYFKDMVEEGLEAAADVKVGVHTVIMTACPLLRVSACTVIWRVSSARTENSWVL